MSGANAPGTVTDRAAASAKSSPTAKWLEQRLTEWRATARTLEEVNEVFEEMRAAKITGRVVLAI